MPRLELDRVTVRYGGLEALREVSFAVEPGSLVALVGPNGAGKTTVFDVVSGLVRPTSGAVRLDGRDLAGRPAHHVAALGVGRTFQIARLFPGLPALDNVLVGVTFGRLSPPRAPASAGATPGGSSRSSVSRPGRPPRPPRSHWASRSGSELAVALAPEPRLLLLDELASGLPPRGRAEVVRFYARLRERGLTVVAIEHALGVLGELADRVVVLDQGAVVADGPPGAVLAAPRVREAYLGDAD